MKVLITGSNGQLGKYLILNAPKYIGDENIDIICPDKSQLDLSDGRSCRLYLDVNKPDWIINSAAFTKVEFPLS